MATKGERQALLFLAAVALLGAGTRWYRARPVSIENENLESQIVAVDRSRVGGTGRRPAKRPKSESPVGDSAMRVDLDRATADEIEALPGIGPALARRIVGDRDANGPFGCLTALDEVKGIGPAMLRRLDSLATFSGPGRPICSGTPAAAPHRQDHYQQNQHGDDDHARKLARSANPRECPASPSETRG